MPDRPGEAGRVGPAQKERARGEVTRWLRSSADRVAVRLNGALDRAADQAR